MFFLLLSLFFAACCGAAATGAMFQPGAWYDSLEKPSWTPPDWLFPLAWTTLYICISIAGARVAQLEGNGVAMAFWSVQIAVNTLWTPVFFGLRRLKAALIIIVALWFAVAGAMLAHFAVDTLSGWLFAPYLLWVTVAGALNYSVMVRNPDVKPVS